MKSASLSRQAYSVLMFLAVSVLAGLLVAGLGVPFAALAGGTTKMAADSVEYLPQEFDTPEQSERSKILMANGEELATFYDENRVYVPLEKISPVMQDAQIAIEDHRFYEHGAIDPAGLIRAFFKTATGDTQGASTLTQQYVKQVQVEAAKDKGDEEAMREATEVTVERKIREMRYAMAVEEKFSKQEILERYLNIAYYGGGAYGVEAAAHRFWGTTAAELTLDQAAMLAGLVKNPVADDPLRHPERAIERRNVVLNRMAELGMITEAERDAAKAVPFDPAGGEKVPNGCVASPFPHMCDYVRRTLLELPALGENREEREHMLNRGGLTIQTLIDPEAQRAAEAAVAQQISPVDPVIAGSVLIQPSTGLIVAMAQSRPEMGDGEGQTYWNYMADAAMGGAEGYQPGSTMKAFTIAAALAAGATPSLEYNAPNRLKTDGMMFKTCSGMRELNEDWNPKNYDRGYGEIDMMKAAQNSVNTYFIQLIRDIGVCETATIAQASGVKMATGENLVESQGNNPSLTLGTTEVSPLSMAEAYATLANRGMHCTPIILKSVTTKEGKELEVPQSECTQVMDPAVADGVSYVLESVMTKGTGRPARLADGRPHAGKTGTTNEAEAVWFAGYTPEMAGIALIASDKTHPHWEGKTKRPLTNLRLANGDRLRGSGGGDAGLIWKAAMASALKDLPKTDFTAPTKKILQGEKIPVPDVRGMGYNEAKRTLEEAGFQTTRVREYSSYREGTFLGVRPNDEAVKFSTITMRVSMGPKPAPPPPPPPPPDPKPEPEPDPKPEPEPEPEAPAPPPEGNNGRGNGNGNDAGDDD